MLKRKSYTYGVCGPNRVKARRNNRGVVEFILWRAGQQGHKEDFWYPMDPSHWPSFEEKPCDPQS